ncbi:peptide-methionine (S)-S-oxide reductase [Sedimentibacter acidaminivorans]|uniref:Peptide methionine sulfoxide reductase MsrA n=1 Tax=Sedimentibacter acidaminivorans TaxID=913099 RepID=A0ABS4GGG9_9FIRM|nr:peptide-methionine (S)-S-oxide reductase MsrA [Sedimentibacter acidaminivorans]MBP1926475.1 peptide-methionine (S)-S-oxide reductase [Sedimentibacter acidaminivorans]
MKEIYLAGGCFWGLQAYFDLKDGITESEVGYANGNTKEPTYEQVCTNTTGYAETVYIKYDDNKISLERILELFWKVIDPTSLNKQGGDRGTQYRTGIYFTDDKDEAIIKKSLENESRKYTRKIVTEVGKLKNYYPAEEYHQKYLEKNPNGYCHIDLSL